MTVFTETRAGEMGRMSGAHDDKGFMNVVGALGLQLKDFHAYAIGKVKTDRGVRFVPVLTRTFAVTHSYAGVAGRMSGILLVDAKQEASTGPRFDGAIHWAIEHSIYALEPHGLLKPTVMG